MYVLLERMLQAPALLDPEVRALHVCVLLEPEVRVLLVCALLARALPEPYVRGASARRAGACAAQP